MELGSQKIVILGGTSGIGLATAQLAAAEGATVVVASSNPERVDAALSNLPVSAEGYALDLRREEEIRDLFERLGRCDHLAYTAGESLPLGPIGTTNLDTARRDPSKCNDAPVGQRYAGDGCHANDATARRPCRHRPRGRTCSRALLLEAYATRPLDLAPEAIATALDSRAARRTSAFRFLRSGAVGVAWMQPSAGEVSPCKPPPPIQAR